VTGTDEAAAAADRVVVEFPSEDGYRAVGRLVLGGLASRFQLPVDRVEELLLALESVLVDHGPQASVRLEAAAAPDGLRVRLGPFSSRRLDDPAVSRVLTRLVDDVTEESDADGATWVELGVEATWLQAGR
jgi:hypothetical protein